MTYTINYALNTTESLSTYDEKTSNPIGDWAVWAMQPHTTEEIRERLITMPIEKTCIAYLCKCSCIEDDFLEEFLVLSTGLFHKKGCDELAETQPLEYNESNLHMMKNFYIALATLTPIQFQDQNFEYPAELITFFNKIKNQSSLARKPKTLKHCLSARYGERLDWGAIRNHSNLSFKTKMKYTKNLYQDMQ